MKYQQTYIPPPAEDSALAKLCKVVCVVTCCLTAVLLMVWLMDVAVAVHQVGLN